MYNSGYEVTIFLLLHIWARFFETYRMINQYVDHVMFERMKQNLNFYGFSGTLNFKSFWWHGIYLENYKSACLMLIFVPMSQEFTKAKGVNRQHGR
jgi:hypothetical protein